MHTFIGVDLGWYGKPSGLAAIVLDGKGLRLTALSRVQSQDEIIDWIVRHSGVDGRGVDGTGVEGTVVAVDAPLVITNTCGMRTAESRLNVDFRRYHAGCHPANLGRPFAANVTGFSQRLMECGFAHGAGMPARAGGKFQIEVYPHAASVRLFGLDRILKYKRGSRRDRGAALESLRSLMLTELPKRNPPLALDLPAIPPAGNLKAVEDRIDAVLCAYIAAHWWLEGAAGSSVYGCNEEGYIIVPA